MGSGSAKGALVLLGGGGKGGGWKSSKQCLFAFKESSTCVNVLFVPLPIV